MIRNVSCVRFNTIIIITLLQSVPMNRKPDFLELILFFVLQILQMHKIW